MMRLTLNRVLVAAFGLSLCCVSGNALVVARAVVEGGPCAAKLTYAFELHATVAAPTELGQVANGRRRIIDITGGTVEGQIKGKVRPGGADWQIVRADGFTELDTRYTIETDKGQLILRAEPGRAHGSAGRHEEAAGPASVWIRRSSISARSRSSRRRRRNCSGSRGRSSWA
jgi:hypothetical protein